MLLQRCNTLKPEKRFRSFSSLSLAHPPETRRLLATEHAFPRGSGRPIATVTSKMDDHDYTKSTATNSDILVPTDTDKKPIVWPSNNDAHLEGTLYEVGR